MSRPTKVSAIRALLDTRPSLLGHLYRPELEAQVIVRPGNGIRIEESFSGPGRGYSYTDGDGNYWRSFRIPYRAWGDDADFDLDDPIDYDLAEHADAVGLTGWNWYEKKSEWVGYDFDSIAGHSSGLEDRELQEVLDRAAAIPWVEVRRSTGGRGYHLYVYLDGVETSNHTEHAALARVIIGQMSAIAGYDFSTSVDCMGSVLWIWRHNQAEAAFELVSEATEKFTAIPPGWRDHVAVIERKRSRSRDHSGTADVQHHDLDDEHRRLINWLGANGWAWEWDGDDHILRTHTAALRDAHSALELRGSYSTVSTGQDKGDINCFAYPGALGSWRVFRYGQGVKETTHWAASDAGWTWCRYNCDPGFRDVMTWHSAVEAKNGAYFFETAKKAIEALRELGGECVELPDWAANREAKLTSVATGRVQIAVKSKGDAEDMRIPGLVRNRGWYEAVVETNVGEDLARDGNGCIRATVVQGASEGLYYFTRQRQWVRMSRQAIVDIMTADGIPAATTQVYLGREQNEPWEMVSWPFEAEYPGGRTWNRDAARLAVTPDASEGETPYWDRVFAHAGQPLTEHVRTHHWCRSNEILTGSDYLRTWVASMIQRPKRPLPYLFFFGPQETGKSLFHEALALLFARGKGYVWAETALKTDFNGELEGSVLCVIEEIDLSKDPKAYNLIKQWVTAPRIKIHPKNQTPRMVENTTHWIQTANDRRFCPVFPGDTRVDFVPMFSPPAESIPKEELFENLTEELPRLTYQLLDLRLPKPFSRLALPILDSSDKVRVMTENRSPIEEFCDTRLVAAPGNILDVEQMYEAFVHWLDPAERGHWALRRFKTRLPDGIMPATYGDAGRVGVPNLALTGQRVPSEHRQPLRIVENRIVS